MSANFFVPTYDPTYTPEAFYPGLPGYPGYPGGTSRNACAVASATDQRIKVNHASCIANAQARRTYNERLQGIRQCDNIACNSLRANQANEAACFRGRTGYPGGGFYY